MKERLSEAGTGRDKVESSKKGFVGLIKPYAEMGMYSEEIRQALIIEKGRDLSSKSIGLALGKARRRGDLGYLTPEEKLDILKDQNRESESLAQRVLSWLFARVMLIADNEQRLPKEKMSLPNGRLEWKDTIEKLVGEGIMEDIMSTTKPLILRHAPLIDAVKIYRDSNTGAISDQEKSFTFIRRCLEEGLIGEDLSSWDDVRKLYALHDRSFTEDHFEKIRLEVFFRAINTTGEKGAQLLLKYKELGDEIDHGWFDNGLAEEEDFIASRISNTDAGGYGEDLQGIYRVGENGEKLRIPIGIDQGLIIYDNSSLIEQRARSRERIAREAGLRGLYSSVP